MIEESFTFETWRSIYAITGDSIFDKSYKAFKVTKNTPNDKGEVFDFTLSLDATSAWAPNDSKERVPKRREFLAQFENAIAETRKNVFAGPFLTAIDNMEKGKMDALKFAIREEEKVYLIPIGNLKT